MTILPLLLALACVQSDPLPDVGDCAVYPDGVYEYGQIGIGTCLAGPTSVTWLGDGHTIAVTNANPFLDFTGGSVLTLDLDLLDASGGRTEVAALDPHALAVPNFSAATAYAAAYELLLVGNRASDGERTREASDQLLYIDVSNPDAPAFAADVGPDRDGGAQTVGADPVEVVYDAATDRAWTLNRTDHTVSTVDLASRPTRLVPPGGDGRLVGDAFVDADASGSRAEFALLTTADDPTTVAADHWDLTWNTASVRAWAAADAGVFRWSGNGEATWVRSGIPYDVPLSGESTARDPAFVDSYDGTLSATLVYVDQGAIALSVEDEDAGGEWSPLGTILEPDEAQVALSDPWLLLADGVYHLYYTSGGDEPYVGHATSADGFTFRDRGALFQEAGSAVSDVSVRWDGQVGRWRAWYAVTAAGGEPTLASAWSDDLTTWTPEGSLGVVAYAPTVAWWAGRFRLFAATADGTTITESTSVDGVTWSAPTARLAAEAGAHLEDGVALQATDESNFSLRDTEGVAFQYPIEPGVIYTQSSQGWHLEVATGHRLGPEDVGDDGAGGVRATAWVDQDVWLDVLGDDGVWRVAHGAWVDGVLSVDAELALEVGAEGTFDADGVHHAAVAQIDGTWTAFYAAVSGAVTTIGRATSADGLTWTRAEAPVYAGGLEWEGAAVVPGSVQVLDDGTVNLWYTGEFGEIGMVESTDGGLSFAAVPGELYPWQLDAGAPGTWYDASVSDPVVVLDGEVERMWFTGDDGEGTQIGYAERAVGTTKWNVAEDAEGVPRPVLAVMAGALGSEGLSRPVVQAGASGWEVLYAAEDGATLRVGFAAGAEPDRMHVDLVLPSLADTWGFTVVPPNDDDAIDLDASTAYSIGRGCMTLALDEAAGMLYAGCKLVPYVYVMDVRDDSTSTWADLNYLGLEAVMTLELSSSSGVRDLRVNPFTGTLYGLVDEPESLVVIRADDVVDDQGLDDLRERVLGLVPLPRSFERDRGVATQSAVGPGQLAMHPDGRHLFVSNYNANSVSVIDLELGPLGTIVAEARDVGEGPYAISLSPDGTRAVVANYSGEVDGHVSSTLVVLDADPASPTFLEPLGWVVNR